MIEILSFERSVENTLYKPLQSASATLSERKHFQLRPCTLLTQDTSANTSTVEG